MVRIQRSDIRSTKIFERRRKEYQKKGIIALIVVAILIGGGLWFFRNSQFMIQSVQVEGTLVLEKTLLEKYANEILDGTYLLILPKRHIFLYPDKKLEEKILEKFPWLLTANIEQGNERSLVLTVQERTPTYLWCRSSLLLGEATDKELASLCYFVDNFGYLFAEAPYFSDGVYVKIYGGLPSSLENPLQSTVLAEEAWNRLIEARTQLEESGIRTHALTIIDTGDLTFKLVRVGEFRVPSLSELRLTSIVPMKTQIDNVLTAIKEEAFKKSYEKHKGMLEYIDARIENSVYYRFGEQRSTNQ